MTSTALTELRRVYAAYSKGERETYHARINSWTKELRCILPDAAMLYIACCVRDKVPPVRGELEKRLQAFGGEPPRPAA